MPLEERLVDETFLIATMRCRLDLEHAVDEQERIAMGEDLEDAPDIDRPSSRSGMAGARELCSFSFSRPWSSLRTSGVELVARPMGDDEAVQVHAEQREVADHVEDLVPGAFVGKAERLPITPSAAEDQQIGLGGPGADAGRAQGLGLGLEQEGPAGRQLAAERGRGEIDEEALAPIGRSGP